MTVIVLASDLQVGVRLAGFGRQEVTAIDEVSDVFGPVLVLTLGDGASVVRAAKSSELEVWTADDDEDQDG